MKNLKKVFPTLLILLVFSANAGIFSLPVLASEKNGVNFEQVRTEPLLDSGGKLIDKTGVAINNIKTFSIDKVNKENLSEPKKKLSTDLLKLIDNSFLLPNQTHTQVVSQMKNLKQFVASEDPVTTIDKRISNKAHNDLVYVYVSLEPNTQTSVIDSLVWNVTDRDEKNYLVVALVEVNKLEALASLSGVKSIRSVMPPVIRSGSVVTEGDIIHQTDKVRANYSQGGAGIKIGVISDGVDHIASAQSSGDLPAGVTVLDNSYGGDEGTAMLEIIHDMVPDSQLYFHTGFPNYVVFNNAVDDLVVAGVNIIVDDLGFLDQPYFEDGTIASHVRDVLASHNIVYVSAAGNAGSAGYYTGHYQGDYYNDGYNFHDFSRGSSSYKSLYVYIPNNGEVKVILQWNDNFGSSGNDYDLWLFNMNGWDLLTSSAVTQNGDDDPLEGFSYTNTTGSDILAEIDVTKYSGQTEPQTLELYIYPNYSYVYPYNITSVDSIFGHAAVSGVIAAGAINTSDPNNDEIEPYSSQGPVTIIGQGQRMKPDVAGIDCVSVTGAGGFQTPFCGTSAAAPHIAAIAAQLWGEYPSATGNQIRDHLLNSAVDLGTHGVDTVFGHGRADSLLDFQAGPTITAFNFASLTPPVIGVINEASSTIILTVPFDTNVTNLVATFTTNNGTLVKVGTTTQISAITSNDFTNLVTYTVTAEDGLTRDYIVTVNISEASDTEAPVITSFTIPTTSTSLIVPITSFVVTDNVGMAGYLLTETSTTPLVDDSNWSTTTPVSYTFSSEGTKTLYAWAKDAAGNISTSSNDSVTITLPPSPDTTAPVIAFHSDITVSNDPGQAGAIVDYALPTATDNVDDSVIVICSPLSGTFFPIGDTTITCDATDAAGNHAIQTSFKITVTDTEAPVITLLGENPQVIEVGTAYTELGATVSDNQPGSVITIDSSSVNTAVVGSYTVTYDAVDASGNHAVQVTRTVDVIAVPVTLQSIAITTPATKLVYNVGDPLDLTGLVVTGTYSDASTKVETITEADVTGFNSSIPVTGQILTIKVGGKTTTYTIDVVAAPVIDTTAPVIDSFIIPETSDSLTVSVTSFVAHDNVGMAGYLLTETSTTPLVDDSNWSTTTPVSYTFSSEGTKTLYAWAKDAAGNISTSSNDSVTITLPDITAPVITLLGDNPVNLYVGDSYTDAGATALDDVDGDLTSSIVKGGTFVDTSTAGTYTITYNVSDTAGNPAAQVVRTIIIAARSSGGTTSGGTTSSGGTTPSTTTKKGDANGDNKIDKYDFSLMMANWGKIGSNNCDLNNDSKVDKYDFALLMSNWSM